MKTNIAFAAAVLAGAVQAANVISPRTAPHAPEALPAAMRFEMNDVESISSTPSTPLAQPRRIE